MAGRPQKPGPELACPGALRTTPGAFRLSQAGTRISRRGRAERRGLCAGQRETCGGRGARWRRPSRGRSGAPVPPGAWPAAKAARGARRARLRPGAGAGRPVRSRRQSRGPSRRRGPRRRPPRSRRRRAPPPPRCLRSTWGSSGSAGRRSRSGNGSASRAPPSCCWTPCECGGGGGPAPAECAPAAGPEAECGAGGQAPAAPAGRSGLCPAACAGGPLRVKRTDIPRVPRHQDHFTRVCTCFRRVGGRKGRSGEFRGLRERRPVVLGSSREGGCGLLIPEGSARKALSWTDACGREWEAQALCSHWGPGWQALLSSPLSLLLKCFQLLKWPREHLRGPLLGKKAGNYASQNCLLFTKRHVNPLLI